MSKHKKGIITREMVIPIHSYYHKLLSEIDDAEWMGDFDNADFLKVQARDIKEDIAKGDVWYPLF